MVREKVVRLPDGAVFSDVTSRNGLLRRLSPDGLARLTPHLKPAPFAIGDLIARRGEPIDSVCFLLEGIAGVLDALEDDRRYAVGLVGSEGFLSWPELLGEDLWPHDVMMRAECGEALRLRTDVLLAAIDASPTLRQALMRFVPVFTVQTSRMIVSSLAHTFDRRMARWILLYHDRVHGDEVCMTHEEFRHMLGVRRSSMIEALHRFEEVGAVRSTRGKVVVRDRSKLTMRAGDTYGHAEDEHRRLLGDC